MVVAVLAATWVVPASVAGGQPAALAPHVPGEVIVRFRPATPSVQKAEDRGRLRASRVETFASGGEHWKLAGGTSVETAIADLQRDPDVEFAEPNYVLSADVIPDDPRLSELYAMVNTGQTGGTPDADIDADAAWDVSRGSRSVVVAVIDTGIDYNHPDLAANIWTNTDEIAGNGVDDDGNGYVDDVHGYDFVNNDPDPNDDNGHGTHCSGTIGAVGNNGVGVVGVNWEVSLMALKFLNASGSGTTADAIRAVNYATANGAQIASNSWGGGGFSQELQNAIGAAAAAQMVFIAAAGNDGTNNDTAPHYPSNYPLDNVIAVAATDQNDAVASFSNYGATTVDIAAPGVGILSTQPGGGYQRLSGTSMATPHVAGVAALLKARFPAAPAVQVKSRLMTFADQKPQLNPATGSRPVASGGRLNAFFSIADPDSTPPGSITDLSTLEAGSSSMGLHWTNTGDDGSTGTASSLDVRSSTSPIVDEASFDAAARVTNAPNPTAAGTAQSMDVTGLTPDTTYYFAMRAIDEWGTAGDLSNIATGTTLPPPTAAVEPTAVSAALATGQTTTRTITVRNAGVGTLDFLVRPPDLGEPQPQAHAPVILDKGAADPAPGEPVTAGSGGPDPFGYRWIDSDEPGGPTFAWLDISATGTPVAGVTGDDSISAPVPLGFTFPLYDRFFDAVRVSSNGFLSFTDTSAPFSNQPLPSSAAPANLVAPLWDDLDPGGIARVRSQTVDGRFVVQWQAMPRYREAGSSLTFQAILEPSGAVTFQYLSMTGTTTSATVGLQNGAKTIGITTAVNQPYLHDQLAVRYRSVPPWLTVQPMAGRLAAGQSAQLTLTIDARGLDGGTYPAQLVVATNDPQRPEIDIDVSLAVTAAADAVVQPTTVAFGDRFIGASHQQSFTVTNAGTGTLNVARITAASPQLTVTPSTFTVAPRASQPVTVRWLVEQAGPFSSSISIASDDAGEPEITVAVTGTGVTAPTVLVDPTSLAATLPSGASTTRTLDVANSGGSDLVVTARADLGNGGTATAEVVSADAHQLGSGGPDGFGYQWRDSDEPAGPPVEFVDISATGTPVSFSSPDDAISATIPMGMSVPFYGNAFSSLKVSTNGWLTFDTTTTTSPRANVGLPTSTLPPNTIAPFWDDLHLRAGGVQTAFDGTRFIVQYTNVGKFSPSTGQSLTFQTQLFPNGRIVLVYRTMVGTLTSATIGIQNQSRDIGLQVLRDAPYVKDDLAVLIARTPDWIRVTPPSLNVPAGQRGTFTVTLDATDRVGGTLTGNVVLGTNVPGQEQILVPTTLDVIGAPHLKAVPSSLAFGDVFIGYPRLTTLQLVNDGTADLTVSSIVSTDSSVSIEEPPGPAVSFPLAPGSARVLNVRWSPGEARTLDAAVRVTSDDPTNPVLDIPVTGRSLPPPVAEYSPPSFSESLAAGDVVTRMLHIENRGQGDLTFGASARPAEILGGGGPDRFGYRWRDSEQAGGPTFEWVDLTTSGTAVAGLDGDDELSAAIPLGFAFPFYGSSFPSVRVSTNGWLSFTATANDFTNDPLPSASAPPALIAAFFDDLDFRGVERARYLADGRRFVVQWTDVDRHPTNEPPDRDHLTFQAILYPTGRVALQYLTTDGLLGSSTVGIQNPARDDGLTVAFDTPYVRPQLAVQLDPPARYLSLSPGSGTVAPGASADIAVTIDTRQLVAGNYDAVIQLATNDPARGPIEVPVSLAVSGHPSLRVTPRALEFPAVDLGLDASLPVTLHNDGRDVLVVDGITTTGDFAASPAATPIAIGVGGSQQLTVTFRPTAAGPRTGTLELTSNDPGGGVTVPLSGTASRSPVLAVQPAAISTALPPGGQRTKTLTITNAGGRDLQWTASDDIPSYRSRASNQAGGPAFQWVDLGTTGTTIAGLDGDDELSADIPLGFAFPFYGGTFSSVRVSTNGWLSFTSTLNDFANDRLPSTDAPPNLVAPFFDDLDFRGVERARFRADGDRFVVQWTDVDRHPAIDPPDPDHLTFEAILYPNGQTVFQYLTTAGLLTSSTVGVQNQARNDGLTVVFNAPYIESNLAVVVEPVPQWAKLSHTSGTVPAGGVAPITLALDAAGLGDGVHEAVVTVTGNDPFTPTVRVPVRLDVGLATPTLVYAEPKTLDPRSNGKDVAVAVELPDGLDPRAISLSSVTLNGAIIARAVTFADRDADGILEAVFSFDRRGLQRLEQPGPIVILTIQGEVTDVKWFRGTTIIRIS